LNRDVRIHPRYEDALLVNATMTNLSNYTQRYPLVLLSLFNTDGKVIAYRKVEPKDYLDSSMDIEDGMAADKPVHFVLHLVYNNNCLLLRHNMCLLQPHIVHLNIDNYLNYLCTYRFGIPDFYNMYHRKWLVYSNILCGVNNMCHQPTYRVHYLVHNRFHPICNYLQCIQRPVQDNILHKLKG